MDDASALEKEIREALRENQLPLEVYASIGSTLDRARELALSGAPEGSLIAAIEQTAGRGRQGRSFFSPAGTGVYMSLVLRPQTLAEPERITVAAAAATARAVETVSGERAEIKWVNDVYLRGKKVSGILTESGFLPDGSPWAALGIGVNLLPPPDGFPAALQNVAGALCADARAASLRGRLIARLAEDFLALYADWDRESILREYRERNFLRGKTVDIIIGNKERQADVIDVADDFGLRVRFSDGREEVLYSGEVHLRPTRGDGAW